MQLLISGPLPSQKKEGPLFYPAVPSVPGKLLSNATHLVHQPLGLSPSLPHTRISLYPTRLRFMGA